MTAFSPKSKPETQQANEERRRPTSRDGLSAEVAASRASEFVDDRPEAIAQRKLRAIEDQSPQVQRQAQFQAMIDTSPRQVNQRQQLERLIEPTVQRKDGLEEQDELQMQAEPGTLQRQNLEDKQLLQGKMGPVQRQEELEEEELLQGKFDSVQRQGLEDEELAQGKFDAGESTTQLNADPGQREIRTGMPDKLKAGIESLSGLSMDGVQVHYNSDKPAQLQALAYAQGNDIHVGPSQEQYLPHEAWHVVQQMEGRVKPTMQAKGVLVNDDEGLEREADVMGRKALQMREADQAVMDPATHTDASDRKRLLAHERTRVVQQARSAAPIQRETDADRIEEERRLQEKYGTDIGPSGEGPHFPLRILARIDAVLARLPVAHVKGNQSLKGILHDPESDDVASTYSYTDRIIGLHKPKPWIPWWLYEALTPRIAWMRAKMDELAIAGYPGVTKEGDRALGIEPGSRSVFGGVSHALCSSSLVDYTLVHEIGHSVEREISWKANHASEERFGAWESIDEINQVLWKFTTKYEVTSEDLDTVFIAGKPLFMVLTTAWNGQNPIAELRNVASNQDIGAALRGRLTQVVNSLALAIAQPWTLADGGGDAVEIEDRMYHMDHYGRWRSYLREARNYAVSNYQFSEPGEWFAEAYAAFYSDDASARNALSPSVRAWFTVNLGLAPGEDRADIPAPELVANKAEGPALISRPEADLPALEREIEALVKELEVAAAEQDQHE